MREGILRGQRALRISGFERTPSAAGSECVWNEGAGGSQGDYSE